MSLTLIFLILFSYSTQEDLVIPLGDTNFITVDVGEPPQKLKFYIDTSSSFNFIFEQNCKGCSDYQTYSPNRSKSLKKSHIYYDLSTIFGQFQGHFSSEHFFFSTIHNYDLDFILVNSTSTNNLVCDGILGFGYDNNNIMSLLLKLQKESGTAKKVTFIGKKDIQIGNVFNPLKYYADRQEKFNMTTIPIDFTKEDYPTIFSSMKGVAFWKGTITDHQDKLVRDANIQISFLHGLSSKMNKMIAPYNKKDFLEIFFKILFGNNGNLKLEESEDNKLEEEEEDPQAVEIKLKEDENTKHLLPFYDNSTNKHIDYHTGILFNDYVLYFKLQSDNDNGKSKYAFNIDISKDISDKFFLSLDYLKSDIVVFDYEEKEVTLYNCISCSVKNIEESHRGVFVLISLASVTLIFLMIITIAYSVRVKKTPHVKMLKNYTLII